ncbi:MAG: A/G-specific adenine glycosylase [Spirochaetia bacterium]|nr:A/G-specific adenine glycosylase [Spirochaetia bacterium]
MADGCREKLNPEPELPLDIICRTDFLIPPFSNCGEPSKQDIGNFRALIYAYYSNFGRKFPWRETQDPYRILLSEMMLQQTQTDRVLPKYIQFLETYPDIKALVKADISELITLWKGLGYNRRALALVRIAKTVVEKWDGQIPEDEKLLRSLYMVGPATAAAIRAFSFTKPSLYLETNIRRVLLYFFFYGAEEVKDAQLYDLLEHIMDEKDPKHWYYALMDYGVFLKKVIPNPNRRSAHYTRQAQFKNSNREIRGKLLDLLISKGDVQFEDINAELNYSEERLLNCLNSLINEGFISVSQSKQTEVAEAVSRYSLAKKTSFE